MKFVKVNKKIFDTLLNVFAWLSLLVAVLLFLTVIFSSFSGTENGKVIFGHKLLIVETDSMSKSEISQNEEIFFSSGDIIVIKEVSDYSEIAVGDVISFVSYDPDNFGQTVSHKVRSIKTNANGAILGFETYGINTGVSDQTLVDPSSIIGKYVNKIPNLGHLFGFFKKPAGFFISMLVPCLLLLIFFSIKVGKQIARKEISANYDDEIEMLSSRISKLETEGVAMSSNVPEVNLIEEPQQEQAPAPEVKADNTLEITAKILTSTVESLTRTIESLAVVAEKPVETLARTVETLALSAVKPAVAEEPVAPEEEEVPEEIVEETAEQPELPEEPELKTCSCALNDAQPQEGISFAKKVFALGGEIVNHFNDVHNELISYENVRYSISFKSISYRIGKTTIAKMVVRGKTLRLLFAINVDDCPKTVFLQEGSNGVKVYADVPCAVNIRSTRSKNNAIKLIGYLADINGLEKNEHFKKENVFKHLKAFR